MEKTSKFTMIYEWIKKNPYGRQADCARELKISGNFVSKWWETAGGFSNNIERMIAWRRENPQGTKDQFCDVTGLNEQTVRKLWAKTKVD